jgi:tetratricopeptide (TPR) repeat protein
VSRGVAAGLVVGLLALPACAPRVAPRVPEGEDYVRPVPVPGEVSAAEARELDEAWRKVRTGDAGAAARDYERLLGRHPGLVPAETGLAYARLRAEQPVEAARLFASALERRPDYVPALVGAGSAAFRTGDRDGALGYYRRALAVDPSDPLVRKRLGALKLQVAERHIAAAQAARAADDPGAAADEYGAALEAAPELATVRLDLAELLVERGDVSGAVTRLQADPSGDRKVSLRLGALLLRDGRAEDARAVYRRLLAGDPADAEASRGLREAQEALDFAAQPEEYRRIADGSHVTRADFAALLAVKVSALAHVAASVPTVAVDISASWAREHIATILGLGIMDVYPNHTFQPGATMRRGDVARALARVLDRLGVRSSGPGAAPTDMGPSHLDRDAVMRVVGAGLMTLGPGGAFEPWRPVSGREAVDVVEALAALVGP